MKRIILFAFWFWLALPYGAAQPISVVPAGHSLPPSTYFIRNNGQWPAEVVCLARLGRMDAWITSTGIVYDFYEMYGDAQTGPEQTPVFDRRRGEVVRIRLHNAAATCTAQGLGEQAGKYNYFSGNDPAAWITGVPVYEEFYVKDILPGIDVRYYFDRGCLRYDYIVHPGADASLIRMQVQGSQGTSVNASGEWIFRTRFGEVAQKELTVYQLVNGQRQTVAARFTAYENTVGFQLGAYDTRYPLIIDPLIWSTFIGGNGVDEGFDVAYDNALNAYLLGSTTSANFPSTPGAYDVSLAGSKDMAVIKLSANGSSLIYATYIGGTGDEQGNALCLDASGNVYITGLSSSSDYPVTAGAYDMSANGMDDAVVTRLNATGNSLLSSTYLGGASSDIGYGVELDPSGFVYVAGRTSSSGYPVTAGSYDLSWNGGLDVFLTKLNANLTALDFSTFIGGASDEYTTGLDVDPLGNPYITGYTLSSAYPTTSGAYDQTYNGGYDIFVSRVNQFGFNLTWSTYLGTSADDISNGIVADSSANAYITGYTSATSGFPVTVGVYDGSANGSFDAYVTKFNNTGTALSYSTLYGGISADVGTAITLYGREAYITGWTSSADLPVSGDAYDNSANGGTRDAFVAKFNIFASVLVYASYLGGTGTDNGYAIAVDHQGGMYITGSSTDASFPVSAGAYDNSFNGGTDAFLTKLNNCTPPVATATSNGPLCPGANILLNGGGGATYEWTGPSGFTSSLQSPIIFGAGATQSGVYIVRAIVGGCDDTASVNVVVYNSPNVGATATPNDSVCIGTPVTLSGTGAQNYTWSGSVSDNTPFVPSASTSYTVTGTDANGCTASATLSLTVNPLPTVNLGSDISQVSGPVVLDAGAGFSAYAWNTSATTQTISVTTSGMYSVVVTDANGCQDSDTVMVTFTGSIGLPGQQELLYTLYPNPTPGAFVVQLPQEFAGTWQAEWTDMQGRVLAHQQPVGTGTLFTFDFSGHAPGRYILVLHNDQRWIRIPVVVQ